MRSFLSIQKSLPTSLFSSIPQQLHRGIQQHQHRVTRHFTFLPATGIPSLVQVSQEFSTIRKSSAVFTKDFGPMENEAARKSAQEETIGATAGAAFIQEEASTSHPKSFLIIHSVSKRQNIGNLLRSATAFGVSEVYRRAISPLESSPSLHSSVTAETMPAPLPQTANAILDEMTGASAEEWVCIIGSRKFSTFGSHGASNYVPVRSFMTLSECCKHLRETENCEIVGVEIIDGAHRIETHPFKGPTAFMLGNEGSGLSDSQLRHCDSHIYISQYGPGTASLNVYVAASIVLHHFALWAGYQERSRTGGKFDLGEKPLRTTPRGLPGGSRAVHSDAGMALLTWEEMKAEQDRRRLKREAGSLIDGHPEFLSDGQHKSHLNEEGFSVKEQSEVMQSVALQAERD